ncbi:flagellar protein FlgN [Bacillus solitudinis]|uniref:flagellar protein FlgN n=1 Tax=Bacillus solitudinis TaxID=2014074 RepID=UPI000C235320|nr:flagellar protein FlgN [Bacillus solitudinis]
MSAKQIIQSLAELIRVHQQLNEAAIKKMDFIKKGDMSALETLVREESKLVSKLRITELIREKQVLTFFNEQGKVTEDVTIGAMLPLLNEDEQSTLAKLQKALVQEVTILKRQNERNQSLVEESLRFVNLSLDLLMPSAEDISYTRPHEREDQATDYKHSTFDSRA